MKLDCKPASVKPYSITRISKRNLFHQIGRVVAIHFGNKQRNLPAVHFRLVVSAGGHETDFSKRQMRIPYRQLVKLEGGRLLPDLPCSYESATRLLSASERDACLSAFEADVINILAGSLAEAKYVALRDDEVFNANLVYLGALKFYGGIEDMLIINEYMECLLPDCNSKRQKKLTDLFLAAYSFINDPANWLAMTTLAETIYSNPQPVFPCEELVDFLDLHMAAQKKTTTDAPLEMLLH
jgi:hypothetical protein